jgi:hypothetical protein
MSSVLLADNCTAHEERIIFVQPNSYHVEGVLLECVIQAWFSTGVTPLHASMNALSAIPSATLASHNPFELLGGHLEAPRIYGSYEGAVLLDLEAP